MNIKKYEWEAMLNVQSMYRWHIMWKPWTLIWKKNKWFFGVSDLSSSFTNCLNITVIIWSVFMHI